MTTGRPPGRPLIPLYGVHMHAQSVWLPRYPTNQLSCLLVQGLQIFVPVEQAKLVEEKVTVLGAHATGTKDLLDFFFFFGLLLQLIFFPFPFTSPTTRRLGAFCFGCPFSLSRAASAFGRFWGHGTNMVSFAVVKVSW